MAIYGNVFRPQVAMCFNVWQCIQSICRPCDAAAARGHEARFCPFEKFSLAFQSSPSISSSQSCYICYICIIGFATSIPLYKRTRRLLLPFFPAFQAESSISCSKSTCVKNIMWGRVTPWIGEIIHLTWGWGLNLGEKGGGGLAVMNSDGALRKQFNDICKVQMRALMLMYWIAL